MQIVIINDFSPVRSYIDPVAPLNDDQQSPPISAFLKNRDDWFAILSKTKWERTIQAKDLVKVMSELHHLVHNYIQAGHQRTWTARKKKIWQILKNETMCLWHANIFKKRKSCLYNGTAQGVSKYF